MLGGPVYAQTPHTSTYHFTASHLCVAAVDGLMPHSLQHPALEYLQCRVPLHCVVGHEFVLSQRVALVF